MSPRPPLGRTGPAGRRGAATTFTPTTLAPGLPAPTGERPQGLTGWVCLTYTSAGGEGQEPQANTSKEQQHVDREVQGATFPRRGPPHPSRRQVQAYLQKLLTHEIQRRNLKEPRGAVQLQEAQGEAQHEEEKEPWAGRLSRLLHPYCLLSCCCLLAFLLLMAVHAETFHILEDARHRPTPMQLRQEMVAAAALVTAAVWCLSALPTPASSTTSEVLLLVLLTFSNACLVLLTRTVLAARTPLTYCCCGWLLGILAPYFLLVLVLHYIPWT